MFIQSMLLLFGTPGKTADVENCPFWRENLACMNEILSDMGWCAELDHPHTKFCMLLCCKSARVLTIVHDFWTIAF